MGGTFNIMKLLLVIALSVVAIEAKPWFYHYPLVYHHPVVKVTPENAPCKNDAGEEVPCALVHAPYYALAGLPHNEPAAVAPAAAEDRKKREAEAEPEAEAEAEADPYYLYGGYYGLGLGYYGWPYGYYHGYYGGCRNNAGALVPCAGRKRREAEAEPEAVAEAEADPEADPYLLYGGYYGYPYYGYGYGLAGYYGYGGYYGYPYHGYYGLAKSAPCVNAWNVPVPCAGAPAAEERKKREAEADPYLLYGGYYGYPYGYGYGYGLGYGWGGYYGLGGYYGHYYGGCRNNAGALVPCALGK